MSTQREDRPETPISWETEAADWKAVALAAWGDRVKPLTGREAKERIVSGEWVLDRRGEAISESSMNSKGSEHVESSEEEGAGKPAQGQVGAAGAGREPSGGGEPRSELGVRAGQGAEGESLAEFGSRMQSEWIRQFNAELDNPRKFVGVDRPAEAIPTEIEDPNNPPIEHWVISHDDPNRGPFATYDEAVDNCRYHKGEIVKSWPKSSPAAQRAAKDRPNEGPARLLHQEARELGRALLAEQSRVGFAEDHDPLVQPAMIETAAKWLDKWAGLLGHAPDSAAGPLASLLAEVYEVTVRLRRESAPLCPACLFPHLTSAHDPAAHSSCERKGGT